MQRREIPFELSTAKAAAYLGVSNGTVRKWADAGYIAFRRTPGNQRRFSQTKLDEFIRTSRSQEKV